ncbi:MAG: hypothetical protein EWV61_10675 [Microcystis aeruginosa Ma_AC_P_19900807_S300]|nr:MAG: hypothetical protein EWV61_10675 [Microcystis aeruginosa Ma_AC_P_19900807_S300]
MSSQFRSSGFLFDNNEVSFSKSKWFIMIPGFFWILYHLITLSRSPLPYFDEAFFASITRSLQDEGLLMLKMSTVPRFENEEVLFYGPVYFYIQLFITNIIGWGIFEFRLLSLLCGFGIVTVIMFIAKRLSIKQGAFITLFYILIFDPELNANMHSARMDSLALLTFLLGIYMFFFSRLKSLPSAFLAGLFLSISLLTTPRIGFLFLILPVGFLLELYASMRRGSKISLPKLFPYSILIKYTITFIIIIVPFFLWIFLKAGGIEKYLSEFQNNPGLNVFIKYFNIPKFYLLPAFGLYVMIILVTILFTRKNRDQHTSFNWKIIPLLIVPLIYIIFIKGGYFVYAMPVLYLSVIYLIFNIIKIKGLINKWSSKVLVSFVIGILFINLAIFGFKSLYLIQFWEARNPDFFESYFESKRISKENILASHQYHFVVANKNHYISNEDNRDLNANKADKLQIKFAFIATKAYEREPEYFKSLGFREIERFKIKEPKNSYLGKLLSMIPLDVLQSYEGLYLQREIGFVGDKSKLLIQENKTNSE